MYDSAKRMGDRDQIGGCRRLVAGFVALHSARYDLAMMRRTAVFPSVKAFLDVLQRGALRRKLALLAGYDTSQTAGVLPER